ncbi:DUF916 and DUF3324 domain-containing protein [Agrilactobacillus yilanensis]|uniref:DUF916 and DUF3324 domain-containing protein n=1 Tax=Agrilactobacillus yilanensis TaxID=2485997 RepID=A0ABW4J828_9LACO|nr:DUF916 and DUF3324 domain-containing protein [Agrilactobacillus yilanensis]
MFKAQPVQAVQVPDVPVDLQPVIPETQADKSAGYFSVEMTPGQTVPMNLKVTNTSKKATTIKVKPFVATTSVDGTISYLPTDRPKDSSLNLDFTKLGASTQTITLKGHESKEVVQNITIPEDSTFKGLVVGSFYVWSPTIDKAKREKAAKKKGVSVYNIYGMYIGAAISVGDAQSVNVDFRLNKVYPGVSGGEPAVLANLQNFKAQAVRNQQLTVSAKVYPRGSDKAIKSMGVKEMSFAPNSNVDLPIVWGRQEVQAGDYTLKMTAKTALRTWHFKKNFTISGKQAQKVNQVVPKKNNYMWLWIALVVLIVIAGIILMSYLYRRGISKGQAKAESRRGPVNRRRKR